MRHLVSLAVAAVLLVAAIPAQAATTINRAVGTTCDGGKVRAYRYVPSTSSRITDVGCPSWTVFQNGKFWTFHRPQTDIEAAFRSAGVWWGHCQGSYTGAVNQIAQNGFHFTYFKFVCP
jgi:hypothetical protein